MKVAIVACVSAGVLGIRISPGATSAPGGDDSIRVSGGASAAAGGLAGAAGGRTGAIQELANLVGPLATPGAALDNGAGATAETTAFSSGSGKEAEVRQVLEEAEKTFAAAADVHEDAKTMEIQNNIAAALGATSGAQGARGGSAGSVAASFLQSPGAANGFTHRNALFTSQLLRMPSPAKINVITKNNAHGSTNGAATWNSAQTAEDFQRSFNAGLASLSFLKFPVNAAHENPSGYEEITVAVENSLPDLVDARAAADERRSFLKQGPAPVLEVGLGSAEGAYPEIASALAHSASSMGRLSTELEASLQAAKASALAGATSGMSASVGRWLGRSSFVAEPTVKITASGAMANHVSQGVVDAVTSLEGKRDDAFRALVNQAQGDMKEIARVMVAEFNRAISGTSFLGDSKNVNVKVMSAEFPSVSSVVAAAEARRDSAEAAAVQRVLNAEMALVKDITAAAARIMADAVSRK